MGDKVWVWAKEKIKSKKLLLPWEGPYVVLAKVSEVNYKVAKLTTPGKLRFLHFNMLKPYVEEEPRPDEANSSKRPTPFRSTGFFDEPGLQDEDLESAIGGQNEIRPIRLPAPHPTPPHRMRSGNQEELLPTEEMTQLRNDTVETYDAVEIEVKGEDETLAPPNEKGMEISGSADTIEEGRGLDIREEVRPNRIRGPPPVRFGIEVFERG